LSEAVTEEGTVADKIISLALDIDKAIAGHTPNYEVLFNALARVSSAYAADYAMATTGSLSEESMERVVDHFCVAVKGTALDIVKNLRERIEAQDKAQSDAAANDPT
jgi:hypothetical protein